MRALLSIEKNIHCISATLCPTEQLLSLTYIYVVNRIGELLFSTRLSQQMLWRMATQRPKLKVQPPTTWESIRIVGRGSVDILPNAKDTSL